MSKFLRYLYIEWTDIIKLPPEPSYTPKYISRNDIKNVLHYFKHHKLFVRFKAVILLGMSSGIRAEELYQLDIDDIDLEKRIVKINHNPKNG